MRIGRGSDDGVEAAERFVVFLIADPLAEPVPDVAITVLRRDEAPAVLEVVVEATHGDDIGGEARPQLFVDTLSATTRGRVEARTDDGMRRVAVACVADERSGDTQGGRVTRVWRATVPVEDARSPEIARLVVAWTTGRRAISPSGASRLMARASVFFAAERGRTSRGAAHEREARALELAGLERMATLSAPAPRLALDTFAWLAAELWLGLRPRGDVLAQHRLTEDGWTVEERAWLEEIARRAMLNDVSAAVELGERVAEARAALAARHEDALSMERYARVLVRSERKDDLRRPGGSASEPGAPEELRRSGGSASEPGAPEELYDVLRSEGVTLCAWLWMEERWQNAARGDAEVRAHLDEACARERAAIDSESSSSRAARGPLPEVESS